MKPISRNLTRSVRGRSNTEMTRSSVNPPRGAPLSKVQEQNKNTSPKEESCQIFTEDFLHFILLIIVKGK